MPQLGEVTASDFEEALAFEAPYLVDKVLEEGLADSVEEAKALFLEVKRYVVMTHAVMPRWGMSSTRIDEVWHNWVLYTREYTDWCFKHFGRFMHHAPQNAPPRPRPPEGAASGDVTDANAPKTFREHYESFFGVALSDLWRDEAHVTLARRARGRMAEMSLRVTADDARFVSHDGKDKFVAEARAIPAMELIAQGRAFFVRELPGLSDEQKIGLISTLAARKLVHVY